MLNPWSTGSDEESDSEEKEGTIITHSQTNSSPAINYLGIRLGSIGYVDLGTSIRGCSCKVAGCLGLKWEGILYSAQLRASTIVVC